MPSILHSVGGKRQPNYNTPNNQPIPGRESAMVLNNTGGMVFALNPMKRVERFLVMGTESNTYYQTAQEITTQNTKNLRDMLAQDGMSVVDMAVDVSVNGRALKNDQALYALALASASNNESVRRHALENLHKVARTGTHLFTFISFMEQHRGWGKLPRHYIGEWYNRKNIDSLIYQVVKYHQRGGWTHEDVLRLAHPKPASPEHSAVFNWLIRDTKPEASYPLLDFYMLVRQPCIEKNAVLKALQSVSNAPWEVFPTEMLEWPELWQHFLDNDMPMTALIRNLPKMTSLGLLGLNSDNSRTVYNQLVSQEQLLKERVHPMRLYYALSFYKTGANRNLQWKPNQAVLRGLEEGFYKSFGHVESTGLNFMLGIDVSGSMDSHISDKPSIYTYNMRSSTRSELPITYAEAAAVMAMVTYRTEPFSVAYGFNHQLQDLGINATDSLETVSRKTHLGSFGSTNPAALFEKATRDKIPVDVFVVYTDGEINTGGHPALKLREYRQKMGRNAKFVMVAMTPTGFTMADPEDPGMIDFVGFDQSMPQAIAAFAKM